MSELRVDTITDELGTGSPDFPNGVTISNGAIDGTPVGNVTPSTGDFTDLEYTGTLTGGTGVVNLGSGQVVKDASGNVGVGTTAPAQKLHVVGNQDLQGELRFLNATPNSTLKIIPATAIDTPNVNRIQTINTTGLAFETGGSERMRIDSSGNVGIGNTSPAPRKLFVRTDGTGATFQTTSAIATAFEVSTNSNNTTQKAIVVFDQSSATENLRIFSNGNVVNTNNSYGGISDIKLKENVVDASLKLNDLNKVRIVNYNLKNQPDKKLLGVVAQELEQVFPNMIDETPDTDREGNNLGTTTKSVKYSVFVPMLIKAVQELTAKVEQLEAQIGANNGN